MSYLLINEDRSALGAAWGHECPRRNEAIVYRKKTYRVVDVAHPTNDASGQGIHIPRVLVRPEQVLWVDLEHLG